MIITTVPFLVMVKYPDFGNFSSVMLYLSSVVGYAGIALMAWQLVLGTRSIAGLYFKDLPGLLKIHSWLGKYGILLIFSHPIFYILSTKDPISYIFKLKLDDGYEQAVTYGRLAFFGLLALWLTSAIVRGMIKYRPWKYIHYLAYPILALSLLHVPDIGNSISESSVRFAWLAMVAVSLICGALRLRHFFGYGKLQFELVSKKLISPSVWQFQLAPLNSSFQIGREQYVYLQAKLWGEEHPFSVLDFDKKTGQILVTFKVFGKFTEKLAQTEPGEILYVDGSYGDFTHQTYDLPDSPRVFIAGGIGITPFVRHILDPNRPETNLFYANQTPATASYKDVLKDTLGAKYINIYSKVKAQYPKPGTELGHINDQIIAKYIDVPTDHDYYICGPVGMIESAELALAKLGVNPNQIHTEKFEF